MREQVEVGCIGDVWQVGDGDLERRVGVTRKDRAVFLFELQAVKHGKDAANWY